MLGELGLILQRLLVRAVCVHVMCEFDATVAMCGLGKCYLLQLHTATKMCATVWEWVGRCVMLNMCVVTWVVWKARVVDSIADCMPCTLVLTPYRGQNKSFLHLGVHI